MIKICFILINLFWLIYAITYDCTTNGTIELWTNEIAFFETNNYTELMDVNDFNKCKLTFILNKTRITTQAPPLAYIVFTEITLSQNRRKIIISDNLEFSMSPSFQNESSAQHGFIVFDDFHKSCPLQSLSSPNQPFHFEDDTQILYLQSTYDKIDFYRSSECNWRFTAPAKYGFKIVVETFNVSDLTWLTVINRTDVITNEIGLQTYHPYYNPDQWMQITLTKDHSDSIKRLEFQAYVTLVKKEFLNVDAKCSNATTGYKTSWTMDQQMGYGKNVNCSYLLIVKPDTEIFVDVDKVVFEKGVDYIRYYPENLPRNYTTISSPTEFIVEPDENGKEKRFVWEFVSDGSIQSSGFEVSFTELPCVCRDANIGCNVPDFNVMNFTNDYYCGNLYCNFTISPCTSAKMIEMILEPNDIEDLYDIFTVYSNDETVLEIDHTNRYIGKFPVYLNSNNKNLFEVVANLSTIVKSIKINVKPFNQPKFNHNITLSAVNSSVIIDTSVIKDALFLIDKSVKSETFVVYSTFSQGGPLFNNESLSLKLFGENCFDKSSSSYKCEIPEKFVTYISDDSDKFPFLAVRLSESHKGCVFDENIFSTKNASFVSISAIATSDAECDVTLLIDDISYYFVSHLYTTSTTELVRVFIGIDQTKEYFHFNSETASKSINIGLFSKVYTIKIPKSTTFLMYLNRYSFDPIIISQAPYQSTITTPNFGTTKMNTLKNFDFVSYQIAKNVNLQFTALEYNMGINDSFYFMANNQKIKIGKKGDAKTFTNQIVTLYYFCDKNTTVANNGALFQVKTI